MRYGDRKGPWKSQALALWLFFVLGDFVVLMIRMDP